MTSTVKGIKDAADAICDAVPDPLIVSLGFGVDIPAKELCFAATETIAIFQAISEGLGEDCKAQSDIVQGAEIEAVYHNSLALYNVKLRLKIEQNLQNTASPMGLFELPSGWGGYLEIARAIVAEIVGKMTAVAQNANAAAANSALTAGDTYYASRQYKSAYKQYQKAYGLAVQ
jgi:hypothetical protein